MNYRATQTNFSNKPRTLIKTISIQIILIENNLPPIISSITIERLKRAGEPLNHSEHLDKTKVEKLDIGFKVFDSVEAPKLKVDEQMQISFPEIHPDDALSRIYNMVFMVGLDELTQVPEEVVKGCIYKISNHYCITNSEEIHKDYLADLSKTAKYL